jgi:hypothetical protein
MKNLSFMIKRMAKIVPTMPDDEEFSFQQFRDYVAGPPEVVCQTHDGFILFHNKEGEAKGLPRNELATSMYLDASRQGGCVAGRVFLAHPDHIAPYWRKTKAIVWDDAP